MITQFAYPSFAYNSHSTLSPITFQSYIIDKFAVEAVKYAGMQRKPVNVDTY